MTVSLKRAIVYSTLCALLLPSTLLAQDPKPAADLLPTNAVEVTPPSLFSAAATAGEFAVQQRQPRTGGLGPAATGALIGAAAALVGTGLAARSYGENESGRFCGACMLQWSALTVPVGAGIGAVIGFGIARARRSVTAVPIFSRSAGAVFVTARF
jgi:hypothetical protein